MSQKNDAYSETLRALANKTRDAGIKPIGGYDMQKALDAHIDAHIDAQKALNAQLTVKPGTLLTAKVVRDLYLDAYPALSKYWDYAYNDKKAPGISVSQEAYDAFFFQARPRDERAVCSPAILGAGYGIGQSAHDDKLDSYSSGVALHELIDKYIKKSDAPPATDFASLSASQLATWARHMYPSLRPLNLTKEPAMTTIKIETKTFISAPGIVNQDAATVSPAQVATAIQRIDAEIKTYEGLSIKPASVIAHIASLRDGLTALVHAVDKANPSVPQPTEA